MTAKVSGDAVLTDAHSESQHTSQPTAYCKDTSTLVERMFELRCPAYGLESVQFGLSPRREFGPLSVD